MFSDALQRLHSAPRSGIFERGLQNYYLTLATHGSWSLIAAVTVEAGLSDIELITFEQGRCVRFASYRDTPAALASRLFSIEKCNQSRTLELYTCRGRWMRLLSPRGAFNKVKGLWGWAASASALLIFALIYVIFSGGAVKAIGAAGLIDPLSVFADRSPGSRGAGALAQTKLAYANDTRSPGGGGPQGPTERVLSNLRYRPLVPGVPFEYGPEMPLSIGAPALELPLLPTEAQSSLGSFPGGIGGSGPIGFLNTGSAGGLPSSGGAAGTPGSGTAETPVSAVPELATWMTMVAGLFSIGWALRSQRGRDGQKCARGRVAVIRTKR